MHVAVFSRGGSVGVGGPAKAMRTESWAQVKDIVLIYGPYNQAIDYAHQSS
jgi:hypothetical protein